jgi:hypothetical protein
MTSTITTPAKARKGDLIVVERVSRSYVIGAPSVETTDYAVGVVASATRDGDVKTWRALGYGDALLSDYAQGVKYARRWVVSSKEIDVEAALRGAKANHWPGHPGQPRPFDSLDEVKAVVRGAKVA